MIYQTIRSVTILLAVLSHMILLIGTIHLASGRGIVNVYVYRTKTPAETLRSLLTWHVARVHCHLRTREIRTRELCPWSDKTKY